MYFFFPFDYGQFEAIGNILLAVNCLILYIRSVQIFNVYKSSLEKYTLLLFLTRSEYELRYF